MVLCRVNGFQESSLRSGKRVTLNLTSKSIGLSAMVQSMLSGLRTLTQYLMITRFLLLLITRESQCPTTPKWCSKSRTLTMLPQLQYPDAVLSSFLQLISSGDHSSRPGAETELKIRHNATQMRLLGAMNSLRNTSLRLTYNLFLTEIITMSCHFQKLSELLNFSISSLLSLLQILQLKKQLPKLPSRNFGFTACAGLMVDFLSKMIEKSSINILSQEALVSFQLSQLKKCPLIKNQSSITMLMNNLKNGDFGRLKNGFHQRKLPSRNFLFQLVTPLEPSISLRTFTNYHSIDISRDKKSLRETVF